MSNPDSGRPSFPAGKLALFAALGAADYALTWHLLRDSGGAIQEGNPVAAWLLEQGGWAGLGAFKAATVLLAAALAVVVFRRMPRTGHRLLTLACAAVTAVVAYSGMLAAAGPPTGDEELAALAESWRQLDEKLRRGETYRRVMTEVSDDLAAGRCKLAEAVARVQTTDKARDPQWQAMLRFAYPGRRDEECLAASIVQHTVFARRRSPSVAGLTRRLEEELRELCGTDVLLPSNGLPAADDTARKPSRHDEGETQP